MDGFIKRRSLWMVVPVFLTCGPFYGMLYLNRGAVWLGYFFAVWFFFVISWAARLDPDGNFWTVVSVLFFSIGLVHGIVIARNRDPNEPLKWYARWYLPAIFMVLLAWSLIAQYSG